MVFQASSGCPVVAVSLTLYQGCKAERCCALLQPSPHPVPLHAHGGQREQLSFRQGPSKRFFETAESFEQGDHR